MELRVDIYVVGLLSWFVLSALSLPGPCTEDPQCVNGICENSTDSFNHSCICYPGYIGKVCDTDFDITISVSSEVPKKNETVIFTSYLTSPAEASVRITRTNDEVANSTASIGEDNIYEISAVVYENVGEYLFDATIIYEGKSETDSARITIKYVLTMSISAPNSDVYFEKGQSNSDISATVSTDGNFTYVNVSIEKNGVFIATLESQSTEITGTRTYTHKLGDGLTESDSGTYVIKATETYEDFSKAEQTEINVIVEVPATEPRINESLSGEVKVTKRNELRLHCIATGIPEPTVSWSYAETEIPSSALESVYQTKGGYLVFSSNVSFQANGSYVCTATNILQSTGPHSAKTYATIVIEGIPEVVYISPDSALQSDVLSFSCEFDAYPQSNITWSWQGNEVYKNQLFVEKITQDPNKYYRIMTELSIPHSALCLGKSSVKCRASNDKGIAEEEFKINQDPYGIYKESYIVFPDEAKNFGDASNTCTELGGSLVYIRSEMDQTAVTGFADQFGFTEFYIGLKYKNSAWRWPNDSLLHDFDKWSSPPQSPTTSDCAFNENFSSVWGWKIIDCNSLKKFACEVKVADKCNGRKAIVNWSPDDVFAQLIEMQSANEIPGNNSLSSDTSSKEYSDLSFGTEYTVKVSSGLNTCKLQPYAEMTFRTAYQKAVTPSVTVNDTSCDISWSYPSSRTAEIDGFKVVVTEEAADVNNGETLKTIKNETITEYNYQIPKMPNSLYRISVQGISCIGNSDTVNETCTTSPEPAKPPALNSFPATSDTTTGITIQLSKYSERSGIIGCVYLVARWTTSGTNFEQFTINRTTFEAIAQEKNEVTDGSDYFAFALTNEEVNVTLGVGGESTTCPTFTSRRKRATVPSNTINAYNRPLHADAEYRLYIILAVEQNGNLLLANGAWSAAIPVSQAPTPIPIAAIVVPVILVILLIVMIVLYLVVRKRQRRKSESEQQQPTHQMSRTSHAHINQAFSENVYESVQKDTSIAVDNLRSTYLTKHADEDRLFRVEYRALTTEVSVLGVRFNYAMAEEVQEKNRFSNIHPANESRVVLRREGNDIYSDYINASYLDGYRHPRKFIASQGPLQNTIGDFWYMVWEQESTVIVMLTRIDEGGRRKCEKYWPDDLQECTFDNNLLVKSVSTVEFGPIIKRTFQVSNPNQSQKKALVEQFHYIAWPDHGVPITTSALFNLRRMVVESQGNNPSPIVVHCSAGVGRTGTFIAMDYLINQMAREGKVDVYGTVFNMRRKRKEVVQTVEQYSLLHKLVLEEHLFGVSDRKTADFSDLSKAHYETIDDEDSFDNLSKVPPFASNCQLPEGAEDKIRDKQILPYQYCKVIIRMRPNEEKNRFINASFVQTYSSTEAFIACQGPVESGIEDFWRVVLDHNVSAIVMLSELNEDGEEHCSQYWPEDSESPRVFGDITITLQSQTEGLGFTERWMQVSEKVLHLRRSLSVMQLQYKNWPNGSVPSDTSDILNVIARSQASRKAGQGKAPVLVHCRDGSGRTGTFCAIVTLIERLKNEDRVDVFRTVKDLRDMRPLMVSTLVQYRFCVQAVKEYLDSFQLYANFN